LGSWEAFTQDLTDGQDLVYPPMLQYESLVLDAIILCPSSSTGGGGGAAAADGGLGIGVVHNLDNIIPADVGWNYYTMLADVRHKIYRVDSCNNNNNVGWPPLKIQSFISIRGKPVAAITTTLDNDCTILDYESAMLYAPDIEMNPWDDGSNGEPLTIALTTYVRFLDCGEIIMYWDNIAIFQLPAWPPWNPCPLPLFRIMTQKLPGTEIYIETP